MNTNQENSQLTLNNIKNKGNSKRIILVIPAVTEVHGDEIMVDKDFSNNLKSYLDNFQQVVVASPAAKKNGAFPSVVSSESIHNGQKLKFITLPEPYREDRYLANYRSVKNLLKSELVISDYVLISPHAPLDWSTLAAEICLKYNIKYNMEADWNLPEVSHYIWSKMPFGIKKIRKFILMKFHNRNYMRLLKNSSLSLVQGDDVYNSYKSIAPNPFSVLNVQITNKEKISNSQKEKKIASLFEGGPIEIVYAGRAAEMKGSMQWLDTLRILRKDGLLFKATWYGDGELLEKMKFYIESHGLKECCDLAGVKERDVILGHMQRAHIFMFCHMTKESPRCLVEALASAAPIIGFGTDYSRGLVKLHGGGNFVERGDTEGLANLIQGYNSDRSSFAKLINSAYESGQVMDRDQAMQYRIDLMKIYL